MSTIRCYPTGPSGKTESLEYEVIGFALEHVVLVRSASIFLIPSKSLGNRILCAGVKIELRDEKLSLFTDVKMINGMLCGAFHFTPDASIVVIGKVILIMPDDDKHVFLSAHFGFRHPKATDPPPRDATISWSVGRQGVGLPRTVYESQAGGHDQISVFGEFKRWIERVNAGHRHVFYETCDLVETGEDETVFLTKVVPNENYIEFHPVEGSPCARLKVYRSDLDIPEGANQISVKKSFIARAVSQNKVLAENRNFQTIVDSIVARDQGLLTIFEFPLTNFQIVKDNRLTWTRCHVKVSECPPVSTFHVVVGEDAKSTAGSIYEHPDRLLVEVCARAVSTRLDDLENKRGQTHYNSCTIQEIVSEWCCIVRRDSDNRTFRVDESFSESDVGKRHLISNYALMKHVVEIASEPEKDTVIDVAFGEHGKDPRPKVFCIYGSRESNQVSGVWLGILVDIDKMEFVVGFGNASKVTCPIDENLRLQTTIDRRALDGGYSPYAVRMSANGKEVYQTIEHTHRSAIETRDRMEDQVKDMHSAISIYQAAHKKAEHSYPKVLLEDTFEIFKCYSKQLSVIATDESTFKLGFGAMEIVIERTPTKVLKLETALCEQLTTNGLRRMHFVYVTANDQTLAQYSSFERDNAVAAQAVLEEQLEKMRSSISSFQDSLKSDSPKTTGNFAAPQIISDLQLAAARSAVASSQASLIPATPEKAEHSYPKVLLEDTFEVFKGYFKQVSITAIDESTFRLVFAVTVIVVECAPDKAPKLETVLREQLASDGSRRMYLVFVTVNDQILTQYSFFQRNEAVATQAVFEEQLEKMRSSISSFQDSLESKLPETTHYDCAIAGPSNTQATPTLACSSSTHTIEYEGMQFSYDERTRIMTAVYVSKKIPAAKNDSLPQVDIKGDAIHINVNSTILSFRHACSPSREAVPFAQWINAWLIELYTAGAFE